MKYNCSSIVNDLNGISSAIVTNEKGFTNTEHKEKDRLKKARKDKKKLTRKESSE